MKYPSIVIGGVRYEPYALMEMQGGEVVSFKPVSGAKIVDVKRGRARSWFVHLQRWAGF